jgi:phosphohistidine phosphatase
MELFLIRHAEAAPLGEAGVLVDADRPLTPRGQQQAEQLATALSRQEVRLGILVTSPLLRARQTAEGLLRHWQAPVPELITSDELAPGGRRRRLSRFLAGLGAEQVALVGHQPELGRYVAWLIGSKKAQISLGKGGVAYVVCDPEPGKANGVLGWLVTAEWCKG